jgi:hypothetical protein
MPTYPERLVQHRLQLRASELMKWLKLCRRVARRTFCFNASAGMENAYRVIDRWATSPGLRAPK